MFTISSCVQLYCRLALWYLLASTRPLGEGPIFLFQVHCSLGAPTTVSPCRILTKGVNDSQSLSVLEKLSGIGIVMGATSLPLAPKNFSSGSWQILWLRNDWTPGTVNRWRTSSTNDLATCRKKKIYMYYVHAKYILNNKTKN